jgi:hypothetical protein
VSVAVAVIKEGIIQSRMKETRFEPLIEGFKAIKIWKTAA